ncbi:MAG TPA: FadR/GntR family transcriptional regulator [Microbacterium sp.]|nr:FadR/GntR family transcriptional regulator [Microbacterium sp.]
MEYSLSADVPGATGKIAGLRPVNLQKQEPASSEVARALLDYIFSGQIGPGEKLPSERQLSESFGVGRSVVREGIKSLGLLGLVEWRHGGGTYLRSADSDLLPRVIEWGLMLGERSTTDLVEARQYIERVTSGLAADRHTPEHLEAIAAALESMGAATNVDEFVDADVRFHLAVADASGNGVLSNMLKNISSLLHVWIHRVVEAEHARVLSEGEPATWPQAWSSFQEHVPVFEAIKARDRARASAAMELHMGRASARLVETLNESNAAQG